MASEKQAVVDELYNKYHNTLKLLEQALIENDVLRAELAEKPTEVEVEKIVEVEADIDLNTPDAIAELERIVEQKLAANAERDQ